MNKCDIMATTKEQFYSYHPEIDYEKVAILAAIFGWAIILFLTVLKLLSMLM